MISEKRKEIYFCRKDWTGQISLDSLMKIVVRRTRSRRSCARCEVLPDRRAALDCFVACGASQ
jgi:hypothetical protein